MYRLPEDDLIEIKNLKCDANQLIDLILLLKKDNFNLQKEITNITIECNKMLRSNSTSK